MIDYHNVKNYLPVAKLVSEKNSFLGKVLFVYLKSDTLLGQRLSDSKVAYAVNVLCLFPSQVSYRNNFLTLAPTKFIPILEQLGFSKNNYIFGLEPITKFPDNFTQILNPKLFEEAKKWPIETFRKPKKYG